MEFGIHIQAKLKLQQQQKSKFKIPFLTDYFNFSFVSFYFILLVNTFQL